MPKKIGHESSSNLPAKVSGKNKIGIAIDPWSHAIQGVSQVASEIASGRMELLNNKEITKREVVNGAIELLNNKEITQREIKLKELDNKTEIIKGSFEVAKEVVGLIGEYISFKKEVEKTKQSEMVLYVEKEKTNQVKLNSEVEILKSKDELEKFLAEYENDNKKTQFERDRLEALVQSSMSCFMKEFQDFTKDIEKEKQERGASDPFVINLINKRSEISDKLLDASKLMYKQL